MTRSPLATARRTALRRAAFAATLAAAAALAAPAAHAQIKLRYAHVGVANAPQTLYADEVAKLVKERTSGRVEIQVFANSQLGGVAEMVDGVRSGAIAMGHHDFASLGRIVPSTAVFNTPFVYRDAEHSMRATDPRTSVALQLINADLVARGNMRIVGNAFQGARQLTSKEKVLSPKDMQGKKYRGVPVKLWSSMITGMGATATPVEVSELATALATGLVVGQENPLPNIFNLKLFEVQKFVMMTNHMQSVLAVFVNERIWQSIPAGDRKIMEDVMREVGQRSLEWDRESSAKYRKDDLHRAEGRARRRGVPQVGARADQQGLPGLDLVHRADPRGEMTARP
jgi:tripartite ATP-independent transporter DctP family solute receptor